MSRIARRFEKLKAEGRAGLVTFITAGDPNLETSAKILAGLPKAGADLIELGMPFSDPMADGPSIQAAGYRALNAGTTLRKVLAMVADFRKIDGEMPLILMGYFNPIYSYGVEKFAADAVTAGVDGVIVVDLPPEVDAELRDPAVAAGLEVIRLATPTTDSVRLPRVLEGAGGFLYYVAVAGVTGTKSAGIGDIAAAVARLKGSTRLPVAVGFGIRDPESAAAVARHADASVVGSAIVDRIARGLDGNGKPAPTLIDDVLGFVGSLATGVRGARAQQ
ncbi:MAG TPA: tryptophan synthase subunit alpha [Alphaproteobacteria bacterium]|jgi:tryptophan synthase alpha chain|nr:tryptophan synthase subunit alpha [Alphaproteobacteria bacterium]